MSDEVQDALARLAIYATLDLQGGYRQMPKMPVPGMGLFSIQEYHFSVPSSFQIIMNKIFHDLHFVTTYTDNIMVHSANEEQHKYHL